MKAILEFDAPKSCAGCFLCLPIRHDWPIDFCLGIKPQKEIKTDIHNCRAPFCPLKIVEDNERYYEKIGNEVQFILDGVWYDAVIIEGYRTHDGIINVLLSDGRKAGCGSARHREFVRPKGGDGE